MRVQAVQVSIQGVFLLKTHRSAGLNCPGQNTGGPHVPGVNETAVVEAGMKTLSGSRSDHQVKSQLKVRHTGDSDAWCDLDDAHDDGMMHEDDDMMQPPALPPFNVYVQSRK